MKMKMKGKLKLNILVIDTSSKLCSVGIRYKVNEGEKEVKEKNNNLKYKRIYKTLDQGRTHSEMLLPLIDEVLNKEKIKLSDIDILGVVIGPGSFTGIRIGISTIKAISLAYNIPVIEITSTEILARNIEEDVEFKIGIIDARNDQIYAGIYDNKYSLIKEFAGSINEFLDELKKTNKEKGENENIVNTNFNIKYAFCGSGIKYKDLIEEYLNKNELINNIDNIIFEENINQDIKKVLEGVEEKLENNKNLKDGRIITPNYLKSSNAERNIKK